VVQDVITVIIDNW